MNSIANNQMSHSCGHIEPLFSPKNPFIIGVIAIYFSPFFFDHPVYKIFKHFLKSKLNFDIFAVFLVQGAGIILGLLFLIGEIFRCSQNHEKTSTKLNEKSMSQ